MFYLFIFNLFILAVPGLSCGMTTLSCGMWTQLRHVDFLVGARGLLVARGLLSCDM